MVLVVEGEGESEVVVVVSVGTGDSAPVALRALKGGIDLMKGMVFVF
jgi:hypothetical protein